MKANHLVCILVAAVTAGSSGVTEAGVDRLLEPIFLHYDAARRALASDTVADVPYHALRVAEEARGQRAEFVRRHGASRRGHDQRPPVGQLIDDTVARALELSEARDITEAREAFAALTEATLALRSALDTDDPVLVVCPLDNGRWLQRRGDGIANPYLGVARSRCGEVVTFREPRWLPRVDPAPPTGPPSRPPGARPFA